MIIGFTWKLREKKKYIEQNKQCVLVMELHENQFSLPQNQTDDRKRLNELWKNWVKTKLDKTLNYGSHTHTERTHLAWPKISIENEFSFL